MNANGWVHTDMTPAQQQGFLQLARDIAAGTKRNTMLEHNRIAVDALVAGGVPLAEARSLVAESLWNLRRQGIRFAVRIPWVGPNVGTFS